ncbi:MAG TPA: histidine phosphotransferase family protein [Rhizomicrobium sp.]|jgi:histidine phosphotransferase ChpT|nr:histidine phosphotransferase family protein [Rhizomicrobium sp.]
MNDLEFAAMLVSRVCHDLVSPVGAVVNGLEVLEDERDAGMRADALKLVASSAEQAAARLQFARVAFGAAGSAGAELDLNEVGRTMKNFAHGGKTELDWKAASANWPKDWAKLLMNATLLALDALPRGGKVVVETSAEGAPPSFTVRATGTNARVLEEVEKAALGEPSAALDGRSIQAYLTHKLARGLNAGLTLSSRDGSVELVAG